VLLAADAAQLRDARAAAVALPASRWRLYADRPLASRDAAASGGWRLGRRLYLHRAHERREERAARAVRLECGRRDVHRRTEQYPRRRRADHNRQEMPARAADLY